MRAGPSADRASGRRPGRQASVRGAAPRPRNRRRPDRTARTAPDRGPRRGGRLMAAGGRIEVAQIVTRFIAGAGGVALRGVLPLDPDRYRVTIITGQGGPLTDRAAAAGMRVVIEPSLVAPLSPSDDLRALGRLTQLCRSGGYDVVHTHSAKAGALGRLA